MKPYYVGCTKDSHLRALMHTWKSCPKNGKAVRDRLQELAALGLKPIFAVIEKTLDKTREYYWINHLKRLGVPLLNKRGLGNKREQERLAARLLKKQRKEQMQ